MDNHPNYYAIIPAPVLFDKRLSDKAKLLYAQITMLTYEKGYCYAKNKYLSKLEIWKKPVSVSTISRIVSDLQKCGHIRLTFADEYGADRRIFLTAAYQNDNDENDIPLGNDAQPPLQTMPSPLVKSAQHIKRSNKENLNNLICYLLFLIHWEKKEEYYL